jgi:hypothetical protein
MVARAVSKRLSARDALYNKEGKLNPLNRVIANSISLPSLYSPLRDQGRRELAVITRDLSRFELLGVVRTLARVRLRIGIRLPIETRSRNKGHFEYGNHIEEIGKDGYKFDRLQSC